MAIKLGEHTCGSHIYMKMKLDNGRIEEIDVFLNKNGSEEYLTSADHGYEFNPEQHEKTREEIIKAFKELY